MAPLKICPCRDCKVHTSICLFICKAYKDWRAENDARNKEISKARTEESEVISYIVEGKDKNNKRRKYKW